MKLWNEYIYPRLVLDLITFYFPLMLIGVIASRLELFSFQVFLGFLVNYILLAFAFIYNDVEDAEADAKYEFERLSFQKHIMMNLGMFEQKKGKRRFQNPFSNGMLTKQDGFNILLSLIIISLILSIFVGGILGFFIAVSNLVVGVLYSGGSMQLKSKFPIDILSHSYLLAGAQIIYFMTFINAEVDAFSIIILLAAMCYSIAGDLWNEYRDFDSDQEAGLKNTAHILGKKKTLIANKVLGYSSMVVIAVTIGYILLS